jgi:hypothetical protein
VAESLIFLQARTSFGNQTRDKAVQKQDLVNAKLIQVDGKVRVIGQPHFVNFLSDDGGQPGKAINFVVPELPNLPVIIGHSEGSEFDEVLRIDASRIQDGEELDTAFAQHARGHIYGHTDVIWVDPRQITELRVFPVLGQLKVNVGPGRYNSNVFHGVGGFDLSSYQPPPNTKRAVGLYLSDNSLQACVGSIVPRPTIPLPEPSWPAVGFKVAVVILYGGQDYVDWEDIKNRKIIYNNNEYDILVARSFN